MECLRCNVDSRRVLLQGLQVPSQLENPHVNPYRDLQFGGLQVMHILTYQSEPGRDCANAAGGEACVAEIVQAWEGREHEGRSAQEVGSHLGLGVRGEGLGVRR